MPTVKLENRETRGRRPQREPFQQSKGRTTVAWRRVGAERELENIEYVGCRINRTSYSDIGSKGEERVDDTT